MIDQAIGPQKTEPVSGIIARMAASAVRMIGRMRRTADSTIASHSGAPACTSWSICTTRITELRMIMPASAITPSIATKPNGMLNVASISATPIMPSGAVSSTSAIFFMSCSCSINSNSTAAIINGITAKIDACALLLDSSAPPTSMP